MNPGYIVSPLISHIRAVSGGSPFSVTLTMRLLFKTIVAFLIVMPGLVITVACVNA